LRIRALRRSERVSALEKRAGLIKDEQKPNCAIRKRETGN